MNYLFGIVAQFYIFGDVFFPCRLFKVDRYYFTYTFKPNSEMVLEYVEIIYFNTRRIRKKQIF